MSTILQPLVLKPSQIKAFLTGVLSAGRVPFIHGSPGIGKSDLVRAVAEKFDCMVIDLRLSQCDPTDLNGFPVMENGRSTYAPNKSFPLEGDPLPIKTPAVVETSTAADGTVTTKVITPAVHYSGWIIFFDELPSAPRSVQAASYKILLDRMVGDQKLHPAVMMAAAGNRADDGAIAEELGTAMQSRVVHAVMTVDTDEWFDWAFSAGINADVIAFLQWKPSMLYNFKATHTDLTFACPRTWHMASDMLPHFDYATDPYLTKASLSGALGQGPATEFLMFKDLMKTLVSIQQIIADPMGTALPTQNGHCYAMAGAISSSLNAANVGPLCAYLGRMGIEYQVTAFRSAVARDMSLMKTPEVRTWAMANARYFQ